jgi:folate-binding protein YgfZ
MTISRQTYHWKPSAWLKVDGPDAFTFLQGQFTNDLRDLEKQRASYGLWLNQKGKVLADSFILWSAREDAFWVGSYYSSAEVIRERLESYIIADDVRVSDETDRWLGMTVTGPQLTPAEDIEARAGIAFRGRRGLGEHWEYVVEKRFDVPGGIALSDDDILRARIQAGIPAVPVDIGLGELPNEGGLEADAISYTKGCYLGQEVMARLKNLGQVRRRLMRVKGEGLPPASPSPLFQNGKKLGELRSVVADGTGFVGLALLTTMQLDRQTRLGLVLDGPGLVELVDIA